METCSYCAGGGLLVDSARDTRSHHFETTRGNRGELPPATKILHEMVKCDALGAGAQFAGINV